MTAYVGDFGLARFLPTNVTNPMKGQSNSAAVWGSKGYVPPGESILVFHFQKISSYFIRFNHEP